MTNLPRSGQSVAASAGGLARTFGVFCLAVEEWTCQTRGIIAVVHATMAKL
jgi:hypothetical protein